jgi:hypothetical protein
VRAFFISRRWRWPPARLVGERSSATHRVPPAPPELTTYLYKEQIILAKPAVFAYAEDILGQVPILDKAVQYVRKGSMLWPLSHHPSTG